MIIRQIPSPPDRNDKPCLARPQLRQPRPSQGWDADTRSWLRPASLLGLFALFMRRPCAGFGTFVFTVFLGMFPTGFFWGITQAADVEVGITAQKATPIAINGFGAEITRILEFDLGIVGFDIVKTGASEFQLDSLPDGDVTAELKNTVSGSSVFRRSYPDGTLRQRVHALADHVVEQLKRDQKTIAHTKVAFKLKGSSGSEIYVADYDGSNPLAMTHDGSDVASPAWVPGKLSLFYTSWRLMNPDIYSHDLVSGTRAVAIRYSGSNLSPAPSPDGVHLAMIMSKSGSPDLWVGQLDGSNLRQLTRTREAESSPCWSPDGKTICFTSQMDGSAKLYSLSVNGGGQPVPINTGGINNATEPDWSPDGRWIAFTRASGKIFQICVVSAKGGDPKILVEGEDPSWSPNSRTLIYTKRGGNSRRTLSLLDVPTSRVKDIPSILGSYSQPSWGR